MKLGPGWQDWVNVGLGSWLLVSPLTDISASHTGAAAWSAYLGGGLVVVVALAATGRPQLWKEWLNAAAGLWLVMAPHLIGFEDQLGQMQNHTIVGLAVAVFAIWAVLRRPAPKGG